MRDAPVVRLELFGGFRVVANARVPPRLPTPRQQQLVAYLVLHAGSDVARHRIAGALWPDSSEAQALTNLRRELHHLRDALPDVYGWIEIGSRSLSWPADTEDTRAPAVDVLAFERASDRGLGGDREALSDAARLYRGDLLPDCAGEWIDEDRQRLRERAQNVLRRLVPLLEADGAFADAIERGQQLLRLDPLDEHAWCALMRSHARRGDRAAALHVYHQCAGLLKQELDVGPSAATRQTYREILELEEDAAPPPRPPRTAVYPLVGRTAEFRSVLHAWHAAAAGRPQLVLIRGEAGIGKTRMAEELVDWCRSRNIRTATTRCYAAEGRLAYAPIASWLRDGNLQGSLDGLEPHWLTEIARLRPEILATRPDVPVPEPELESWQRTRFFEALAHAFRSAAPLLLVVDDLQWSDADTVEWLHYLLRSAGDTRCLVLGTVRAEEEQDNPALQRVRDDLARDGLASVITLGPLDRAATVRLAGEVAGRPPDEALEARIFRETEGYPLFIIERERMEAAAPPDPSAPPALSPRVQSIVAARLALLSPEAREALDVAAAVGRDFTYETLAHASDLEPSALVRALDELWRRHVIRVSPSSGREGVEAGERWDFSHDRFREAAYIGIGPARRRLIHRRIAQAIELTSAGRLDEVSAEIATHLNRGGQPARAIPFLARAAAVAARVSANEEAIRCLMHALGLLEQLPPGRDRDEKELALRTTLSAALNSARGYGALEVEDNLNRILVLHRSVGSGDIPVRWLWAAFTVHFMRGELKAAHDVSTQALARSETDPACRCEAHHAMAGTLMHMGALAPARRHFETALAAYDERQPQRSVLGSDLGVFAHGWYSHGLWLLGEDEAALAHADEAIALARRQGHLYGQALAFAYAALLHQLRQDVDRVVECAETVVRICERHGFGYYDDWARVLLGWVHGRTHPAEGAAAIELALGRFDARHAHARRSYYLSLLAETYAAAGDRDRAARTVDHAIALATERSDEWWLPALYLQQGEFQPATGAACRRRALDLARAQQSRALERRILACSEAAAG